MSHLIKKIGSNNFIKVDWAKAQPLSPNYSAQSWQITDTRNEGTTVELYCPETLGPESLKKGSFYQIFSEYDLINPIAAFELQDIQSQWGQNPYQNFKFYKLLGRSYRSILYGDEGGLIIKLNTNKIKFKDLMIKIAEQISAQHPAFSASDEFIEDINYYFSSLEIRQFAGIVFEEIEKYGFSLFYDKNLKLHAISSTSEPDHVIDWDYDLKIKNKDGLNYQSVTRPFNRYLLIGKSVLSSTYEAESWTATGEIDQKFELTYKPGNPTRTAIEFEKPNPDELNPASIENGDTISNGRITINKLVGQTFNTQYRNYKTSIDASGGIILGTSLALNSVSGQVALLGLLNNPGDAIGEYIASFLIQDLTLKIIFQGSVITPSFPPLVPTLKQSISSINGNQVTVSSGTGYTIGQDVIFDLNGEILDVAQITNVSGNIITVNNNVTYVSGMKLYQQADYLLKYAYYPDQIIFYAKKDTDNNFQQIGSFNLTLSEYRFLQLYANQEHSVSLDWLDLTENITIQLNRGTRPLDIAFEESAARLQAEAQIYYESSTEKWTIKLPALLNDDEAASDSIFIITTVINDSNFILDNISAESLKAGDRVLINKAQRYINSIDYYTKTITINSPLAGVVNSTPLYKTEVYPAEGEILTANYLPAKDIDRAMCPTDCLSGEGQVTKPIVIETNEKMTIAEFEQVAQIEIDKICYPELAGTYSIFIEHVATAPNGHFGLLANMPMAGQKIKLTSSLKTELNEAEGIIDSVSIRGLNQNTIQVDISIGTPINKLQNLLTTLQKRITRQSILINENIPDKSFLCTIRERLYYRDSFSSFSSRPAYNHKNGLYKVPISGLLNKTYSNELITLSNISKTNSKNSRSKVPISGHL